MRSGRRWSGAALAAGALSVVGIQAIPAGAQFPTTVKGCTQKVQRAHGNFRATLHTPGHHPSNWKYTYDVDAKKKAWVALWPIRITASRGGHAIRGKVMYQFLFNGRVVACRPVSPPYHPRFNGRFRDVIQWPERSIGIPLTFRAVVTTPYGVKNLNYSVKVAPRHH